MMNNDFCDVTLVRRDNQKLEVMLSAYNNVFKNILASDKRPDSVFDYAILEPSDAEPWTEKFEKETNGKTDRNSQNCKKKKKHW